MANILNPRVDGGARVKRVSFAPTPSVWDADSSWTLTGDMASEKVIINLSIYHMYKNADLMKL